MCTGLPGGEVSFEARDFVCREAAPENLKWVRICYEYEVPGWPEAELSVVYTVEGRQIHVKVSFRGVEGMPSLPALGLRFILPERLREYTWSGLSGETYPDRYRGGRFGIHTEKIEIPRYLVPQECNNHMSTMQMQIGDLRFVMDEKPFQFSVLPYTAEELENALHREELPYSLRTVVNILGFMRGVGGIDSWGSDVEEPYRLPANRKYEYSFYLYV